MSRHPPPVSVIVPAYNEEAGLEASVRSLFAYALHLDRERLRTLWVLPFQQIVYRQLMYLVVIQSLVTAILGVRLRWHVMRRTGTFADAQHYRPERA